MALSILDLQPNYYFGAITGVGQRSACTFRTMGMSVLHKKTETIFLFLFEKSVDTCFVRRESIFLENVDLLHILNSNNSWSFVGGIMNSHIE
jgi:hypothetical protein